MAYLSRRCFGLDASISAGADMGAILHLERLHWIKPRSLRPAGYLRSRRSARVERDRDPMMGVLSRYPDIKTWNARQRTWLASAWPASASGGWSRPSVRACRLGFATGRSSADGDAPHRPRCGRD